MANNQSGVNAHTIVANGRITVPSGRNLLNESTRTLMPSQGALAYGEDTILLYYGDDTDWLLLAAGGIGPTGATGASITGPTGASITGPTGASITGPTGASITGPTGSAGGQLGAAEFVQLIQGTNNSVPPGTAFQISTQVFNSSAGAITSGVGDGGTVFTISVAGTYIFDYELSLGSAGSIALYTGPTVGSLVIDNNTIAGSTTATSWIHGRAAEVISIGVNNVVALSSVVGTAAVVTAGTAAGFFIVRMNIQRVA